MALSRIHAWVDDEILFADDLGEEFDNLYENALTAITPLTGTLDANNQTITRFLVDAYTTAGLPSVPTAGRLARVTDGLRGLHESHSSQWSKVYPPLHVAAFGATGDGTTDDTAAIQAAIDAAAYGSSFQWRPIAFEPGKNYKVSSTLTFIDLRDGMFLGHGASFTWAGNATDPLMLLRDVRDSVFRDFRVIASAAVPLATAIQSENGAGGNVTPTRVRWDNIELRGTNGGLAKGWRFALGAGGNNNNDINTFVNCLVRDYTTAAWSFEHSNSRDHLFLNCGFQGASSGQRGVATNQGTGTQGGTFTWVGGAGGGNSVADFDLGSPNRPIYIAAFTSENSSRLLKTSGGSGSPWAVTIEDVRFASTNLHADGFAVIFEHAGPLTIRGCDFGAGAAPVSQIRLNFLVEGRAEIVGNAFNAPSAVDTDPISITGTGPHRVRRHGNTYANAGGTSAYRGEPGPRQTLMAWVADDAQNPALGALPPHAYVTDVHIHVTEAFNSDGTDLLTVGYDADPDAFATSVDVSTTGVKAVTLGVLAGYTATARAVEAYYVNGGTEPTTGKALVILEYIEAPEEVA